MNRRRWIIAAAVALLMLSVGWWFGSPWLTLWQIRSAAEKHDVAALSGHVDYPALREDVRVQLSDRLGGGLLGGVVAGGLVEAAVRPEALQAIFVAGAVSPVRINVRAQDMRMVRDGLDQFRMVSIDGKGGELIFRRHGLGWKLAGIRLPEDVNPLRR